MKDQYLSLMLSFYLIFTFFLLAINAPAGFRDDLNPKLENMNGKKGKQYHGYD